MARIDYICARSIALKMNTSMELLAAKALASKADKELRENILPYWRKNISLPSGLFLGRISGHEEARPDAPIGGIMTARILWTFASAYRIAGREEDLEMALKAKKIISEHFFDSEFGGTYWAIAPDGSCLDSKKQIYAIAFTIYGLAELFRATRDQEALDLAIRLFRDIEQHSFDHSLNGYFEAFQRNWEPIGDMRLSDKDANESKTMNTHLHILEAYTGLYRVWKDALLHQRLKNLIELFLDKIIGTDFHLKLFFSEDWNCNYDIQSFGHDIEASWLLHEAAIVLGDKALINKVEKAVPAIVRAASEGYESGKGMAYEKKDGTLDMERHWWVQAESVVGYFNLWQLRAGAKNLEKALATWDFIEGNLVDRQNGEWFWSIRADGSVNRDDDKAGFWKCPYHNGRMCMEIIERCKNLK